MEIESFHPSSIYTFFQVLAGLTYVLGILLLLRENFSLNKRIVLILASTILVGLFASEVSWLAGGIEGQSYFGALAAQILGVFLFLKFSRTQAIDRAATWKIFSGLSGVMYALLRFGCHFRGCCWGRICPYPWAVSYKSSEVVTPWLFVPLHPVQLYSAFHGLLTSVAVLLLMRRAAQKKFARANPAHSLGLYLILIGIGRLFTDYFRADASFYKQSWFGFFPNTLIAITAAIIGLAIVATSVVRSRESFDA